MTYVRLTAIIDRLQPFIHRDKPETQIHLMQTVAPNMYNDCTHSHVVNADMQSMLHLKENFVAAATSADYFDIA